ncbi:MAG TPA: GNAT family N-acetyltransferase [Gemmatimonadaceae bacterium]|nr:GNAT family N-acetyltransferase [Gemmatimonadaceae bacterium]
MNTRVERLNEAAMLDTLTAPGDWPTVGSRELSQTTPDATYIVRDGASLRARCSVWWRSTPPLERERIAVVGHFAAGDSAAAGLVLDAAVDDARKASATLALGPMDGNTWRRYRLVIDRGTEPPFLLEPWNPAEWPEWWRGAGWSEHAEYISAANEDLSVAERSAEEKARAIGERGVTLRPLDVSQFDAELGRIYEVARVAFRGNYLYTSLDESSFRAQYGAARQMVMPELVTLAEHEGRCVGFFFALPNVLEAQRGEKVLSAIAKTFAVLPEYRGLGAVLAQRTHDRARELGFQRMIHALIHVGNDRSRVLSSRTAREIRRYALFERRLATP